jgi:hypothetical protein
MKGLDAVSTVHCDADSSVRHFAVGAEVVVPPGNAKLISQTAGLLAQVAEPSLFGRAVLLELTRDEQAVTNHIERTARAAHGGLEAGDEADVFRLIVGRGRTGQAGGCAPDQPGEGVGSVSAGNHRSGPAGAGVTAGASIEGKHKHVRPRRGGREGAGWQCYEAATHLEEVTEQAGAQEVGIGRGRRGLEGVDEPPLEGRARNSSCPWDLHEE